MESSWGDPLSKEPPSATLQPSDDPYVRFFDLRFHRARELLVFMEETKIWQRLLTACNDQAGINASLECRHLVEIVTERMKYYNASYEPALRPKLSPGLPEEYEKGRFMHHD